MKAFQIFAAFMTLFISLPIWYYLLYKVLQMVGATDLMWFLYWVYVPLGLFVQFCTKAAELDSKATPYKSRQS